MPDRLILLKKAKIMDLLDQINDRVVGQFFNLNSNRMLDKKIQVLSDLISGKQPAEIDGYYSILEDYPKQGQLWD